MPRQPLEEIVVDGRPRSIEIDAAARRLELHLDDDVAFLEFHEDGDLLSLMYVEVPPAYRGRGLGDALSRAALDHARARGMKVKPYCSFVKAYVRRHPEYHALVATE